MSRPVTIADYKFVRVEHVVEPPDRGMVQIYSDCWWTTRGGEELAFFKGHAPQCNPNESIVKRLAEHKPWDVEVKLVPRVYLPVTVHECFYDGEYDGLDFRYVLPWLVG